MFKNMTQAQKEKAQKIVNVLFALLLINALYCGFKKWKSRRRY